MSAAVLNATWLRRLALLCALVTSAGLVTLESTPLHLFVASGFIVLTLLTIDRPGLLPVLIVAGQVAAGAVLLALDGGGRWMLLPVVMSLVASAELIGALARRTGPVTRVVGLEVRRCIHSAAVGGAVFSVVLLVGDPRGPGGGAGGTMGALLVLGAGALLVWGVLRDE